MTDRQYGNEIWLSAESVRGEESRRTLRAEAQARAWRNAQAVAHDQNAPMTEFRIWEPNLHEDPLFIDDYRRNFLERGGIILAWKATMDFPEAEPAPPPATIAPDRPPVVTSRTAWEGPTRWPLPGNVAIGASVMAQNIAAGPRNPIFIDDSPVFIPGSRDMFRVIDPLRIEGRFIREVEF